MVSAGAVWIDRLTAGPQQRVRTGQEVSIRLLEPPDKLLPASHARLEIIYEDPWLLVIDKPAGIVAHPVGEFQDGTISNVLQQYLDTQTGRPGLLRAGIVHRLDRLTSGLLVIPKDQMTHRRLSIDFQSGRPKKWYTALVEGRVPFDCRTIDRPIGRLPGGNSVLMSAADGAERRRPAKTDVETIRRLDDVTLVQCRLHTGRNHQIRVHLAAIGHPVLGDEFYGPLGVIRPSAAATAEEPAAARRHALHATRLEFQHPVLQTELRFDSAAPADFWELLT